MVLGFLALCALALLAMSLSRPVLRQTAGATTATRIARWATFVLVGRLCVIILGFLARQYLFPRLVIGSISGLKVESLLIPPAIMATFLLSAIVKGDRYGLHPQPQQRGWRIAAGIDLIVSLFLLFVWAILVGLIATFLAAFYMHLVG